MANKVVKSNAVKFATFHRPCHLLFRLDILPFVLLYATLIYAYFMEEVLYGDIPLYLIPIFVFFHILTELSCYWSVNIRTFVGYSRGSSPLNSTCVKVIPIANKGSSDIINIEKKYDGHKLIYFINWRKRIFLWNENSKDFRKIHYPTNLLYSEYLNWKGYANSDEITTALFNWDKNKFDIPIPKFMDLYREQALSPFFVFQIFCVLLWLLDEYWYYALFTFIMLFIFEATIVQSRLRNLTCLRNMMQPSHNLFVFRGGKWSEISSYELLPGDICSIVRKESDILLPCDFLLIKGSAVVNEAMLTGESTPQLKESISHSIFELNRHLELQNDSIHILYGGTNVINHILESDDPDQDLNNQLKRRKNLQSENLYSPPDRGCIGYVLRTGFETNQGKLIRTILYSTDRVTANNLESLLFILFLLIFAISASGYVLMEGWFDENRSRYKLILKCVLIITSVVPPELPMELSLAVNNSLIALSKLGIFCTEPFRIPFAGKTKICCFDKTGTLTSDELILKGIAGLSLKDLLNNNNNNNNNNEGDNNKNKKNNSGNNNKKNQIKRENWEEMTMDSLVDPKKNDLSSIIHYNIAGCHSILYVDDKLVGDPMEVASLRAMKWNVSKGDVCTRKSGHQKIHILNRFHFSSNLKRMSTVIGIERGDKVDFMITAKGAPEILVNYMIDYPENYHQIYRHFAREGYRAVALAHRVLPNFIKQNALKLSREDAEKDLVFTGFLIFECPIKNESYQTIDELKSSSHRTVMITGDNLLTACKVANVLKMNEKPTLILEKPNNYHNNNNKENNNNNRNNGKINNDNDNEDEFRWVSNNEEESFRIDDIKSIKNKYDLCVSGESMKQLIEKKLFKNYLESIIVFARVSPVEKEDIIVAFKSLGNAVLMCGDGTNDVGALKQAQIGVALLNTSPNNKNNNNNNNSKNNLQNIQQKIENKEEEIDLKKEIMEVVKNRGHIKKKPFANISSRGNNSNTNTTLGGTLNNNSNATTARRKRPMGPPTIFDDAEMASVKLGDASIAAPFTTKGNNVWPIVHIIRQGRCTLVTTLQMYMILALNCLISAYSLSVLSLSGVKMGDTQATMTGLLIAFCFLFISRSKPLDKLSMKRPYSTIFNIPFFLTFLGQFAVHLYSLIYVHDLAISFTPPSSEVIDIDAPFTPNLINSAVFLISASMQVATFVVNYRGHPFMQSIKENKPLLYSLSAVAGVTYLAASQISTEFSDLLELVPFDPQFRSKLLLVMFADFGIAFGWDRLITLIFG